MRRFAAALTLAVAAANAAAQAPSAHLDLAISLDPATRELRGRGVITAKAQGPMLLVLGRRFEMLGLTVDGAPLASPTLQGDRQIWQLPRASGPQRFAVEWRGTLAPLAAEISHRDTLTRVEPSADVRGSFLPAAGSWYPAIEDAEESYRVAIDLPSGQKAVVPGRIVEESEAGGRYRALFEFPHVTQGIDLMAGPYNVTEHTLRSTSGNQVKLRTYFHPEISELAAGYLDAVKGYIELYEGWIGAYPYTEFSVVSSPTPTGFGMPTLTYLGIDVLRLPFIRATSLGHEVLHSWWGNGIRVDYARGNWSEGLTTFMADYAYKERAGEDAAREMRLEWLRDLSAVPPGSDRPLAEFTARYHGASQIVGYHKAAMVFLMLRDQIGRATFDEGLRRLWREYRYRAASWDDLRRAFELAAGTDLAAFFGQWLSRTGLPSVRFETAGAVVKGEGHAVRAVLEQNPPAWQLRVPLVVNTERGVVTRVADVDAAHTSVTFDVGAAPKSIVLDPDFRVLRRLAADEAPPILRQVMVDPNTRLVVASPGVAESAVALASRITDQPPKRVAADVPPPSAASILVIGLHDDVDAWLTRFAMPTRPATVADRGVAQVWIATVARGQTLAVVAAQDAASLTAVARLLPHYGRQSWLIFDAKAVGDRGIWPAHPQEWPLP